MYVSNSDNVGYTCMKKAFNDTLPCLFPLCVHITCNIVTLLTWLPLTSKKGFKEVNEFVKCFTNLFFIPSGRKSRFLTFLRKALGQEDGVKMSPNPNTKSWGAWFESVLYHAGYYLLFEGFIKEELDRGQSFSCSSLLRLEEMYSDHSFMKKLGAHLSFFEGEVTNHKNSHGLLPAKGATHYRGTQQDGKLPALSREKHPLA